MTTRGVVHQPPKAHHCNPGVRWAEFGGEPHDGLPPAELGWLYAILPTSRDYPAGTVWQCACGKTYVSLGTPKWARDAGHVATCFWRRERWRERRRRERQEAR